MPGVRVFEDPEATTARLFGARVSGQVLLYDAGGKLLFNGGITAFRGHPGTTTAAMRSLPSCVTRSRDTGRRLFLAARYTGRNNTPMESAPIMAEGLTLRAQEVLSEHRDQIYAQTSRLFAILMIVQWIGGIAVALLLSPRLGSGPRAVFIYMFGWRFSLRRNHRLTCRPRPYAAFSDFDAAYRRHWSDAHVGPLDSLERRPH